ncbi:MAG: hypothetical protein ACOX3S_05820 [Anaerolineae bacterium]|jgi:hypothetical protein
MPARIKTLYRRADSPFVTLALVLALYLAFFGARLAARAGDVSGFVWAGDRFTDPATVAPHLSVLPDSDGYDGQFYYRLAIEPFTNVRTDNGVSFDRNPAYRQQRILYPLLAHLLSLGQPRLVPAALVVVNLISVAALGWCAGALAQTWGRHALEGLLVALYPGLLLTFDLDLAEILSSALLTATLFLLARQRHALATLTLCLAVLAKETTLGVAAAALPAYAWSRLVQRKGEPRWHLWLAPGALYVGWQAWLRHRWGAPSLTPGTVSGNVSAVPARPHTLALWRVLVAQVPRMSLMAVELLAMIVFVVLVLVALWRSRASLHIKLTFLGYAALAVVITHYLGGDWAFMRALAELWMVGGAVLLAARHRSVALLAPATLVSWCTLALVTILYR